MKNIKIVKGYTQILSIQKDENIINFSIEETLNPEINELLLKGYIIVEYQLINNDFKNKKQKSEKKYLLKYFGKNISKILESDKTKKEKTNIILGLEDTNLIEFSNKSILALREVLL